MTALIRLRQALDERRYRDYARSTTAIFYHWQPFRREP